MHSDDCPVCSQVTGPAPIFGRSYDVQLGRDRLEIDHYPPAILVTDEMLESVRGRQIGCSYLDDWASWAGGEFLVRTDNLGIIGWVFVARCPTMQVSLLAIP